MFRSSTKSKTNGNDLEDFDSDTSLGKFGLDNDITFSSSSSSSSSTSKSSPLAALQMKKSFRKTENSKKFDEPSPSENRRPSNPLAKPDVRISLVDDCLDTLVPPVGPKKDETPFSTIKFGSDTLEEAQEKEEFLRGFEKENPNPDYANLNKDLDLELSPSRPLNLDQSKLLESFDGQPHQISTPLHHRASLNPVQESLSNVLDQELEEEKKTTTKQVKIAEPPVRPSASIDEFQSTKSDTFKDFNSLHQAYRQTIASASKSNVRPTQKPVVTRPKIATENVDSKLIEELKRENESLKRQIRTIEEEFEEKTKEIRSENFALKAKIENQSTTTTTTALPLTKEQRDVEDLEKLISVSQTENERLCKRIREFEQEKKQMQKSMFEENEKLRREILRIQQENQPTTITIPSTSNVQLNSLIDENQRLKKQIEKHSIDENRIRDFERQVKELELINRRHQTNQIVPIHQPSEVEFRLTKAEECLRERDLHIDKLTKQLENLQTKKIPSTSLKRDIETMKILRADLQKKTDQLDKLRALYDAVNVQHKSLLAEREREKSRATFLTHKPYQPDRFSQTLQPIEVLQEENSQLKHLIEKLEENSQREHVELMELRQERQAAIAAAMKTKDDEIVRLRQQHQNDLQKLLVEFSTNENENRLSELMKKIETNEKLIAQLQKSLENANEKAREAAILRVREDEMKITIERLERDLHDAQNYQTPEMKHFHQLQNQIQHLEQRWNKREEIHRNYATKILKSTDVETNEDVEKLRAIIREKNSEIERFRSELDSMLKLLKTLKFQQMFFGK